MGAFRRKVPNHYIPMHPDNVRKKDWVIVLEAETIVGPSTEKLRVAKATQEKKIVRTYNIFCVQNTSWSLTVMIRKFMPYISVRNSTNPIVRGSFSRSKERKSENCLSGPFSMGLRKSSHGTTHQENCKMIRSFLRARKSISTPSS